MKYPSHIVAVGTLVQNKRGEFLLVKTEWRGWEMPGGQVEQGEDIVSALKRETKEESGIDIEIIEKISSQLCCGGGRGKIVVCQTMSSSVTTRI